MHSRMILRKASLAVGLFCGLTCGSLENLCAQDTFTKEELEAQGIIVAEPEPKKEPEIDRWVLGLRAGAAIPTAKELKDVSSDSNIGPLVNLEALYALKEWLRLGLMFEWHQHDITTQGSQFGTIGVYSLLPTVEFRATRAAMQGLGIKWFIPYASLGTGVNFHSFSNATKLGNASVSFSNTFALRPAGGLDFPLTSHLSLNTEIAWNMDSGTYKNNGVSADSNMSSLNLMVGLRAQF